MHVGMAAVFQNPHNKQSDHEVYQDELRLTDLAEPLGFDSIWGVEHHFTDYTMCPDVLQFLTYMAGRTQKIKLGSMAVVLPWHDPMRVAEQISMLDMMSGGRLILGLGRGLGRIEFEGFGLDMSESRPRFIECAQTVLEGLEKGYCEFDGEFIHQTRRDIRPRPRTSFRGRTYAAAVSPESSQIMARLGVGLLIIPQKPWDEVAKELDRYREMYLRENGEEAPPPICAGWTFCDENEERAYEMAKKYIVGYWETVIRHYEFTADHFKNFKGYEYYVKMTDKINKYGLDEVSDFFLNLQIWGTPEQCYEKILKNRLIIGYESFVGVFSYAAMPYVEAERNLRLFAKAVMPELQKVPALKEQSRQSA